MATEKPNVLLILADDIDRIAAEGVSAAGLIQQHVATFTEFPPRQAPADFNPQGLVEMVLHAAAERQGTSRTCTPPRVTQGLRAGSPGWRR